MCPAGREQGLSYSAGAGWGTGPALPTGPEREHLPAGRPGREGALESAGRGCSSQGSPAQGHRAQGRPGATRTKEAASNQQVRTPMGAERPWAVTGERERQILDGWGLSGPESEHLGAQAQPSFLPLWRAVPLPSSCNSGKVTSGPAVSQVPRKEEVAAGVRGGDRGRRSPGKEGASGEGKERLAVRRTQRREGDAREAKGHWREERGAAGVWGEEWPLGERTEHWGQGRQREGGWEGRMHGGKGCPVGTEGGPGKGGIGEEGDGFVREGTRLL